MCKVSGVCWSERVDTWSTAGGVTSHNVYFTHWSLFLDRVAGDRYPLWGNMHEYLYPQVGYPIPNARGGTYIQETQTFPRRIAERYRHFSRLEEVTMLSDLTPARIRTVGGFCVYILYRFRVIRTLSIRVPLPTSFSLYSYIFHYVRHFRRTHTLSSLSTVYLILG